MMTVTLASLIDAAYLRSSLLEKQDAEAITREALETIKATLAAGEDVKVSNFGTFVVRRKPARIGRNPKNPVDEVTIEARRVVVFRPATELRLKVAHSEAPGSGRSHAGRRKGLF